MAVHFQERSDPIAYTPDADRTVLVPDPGSLGMAPEAGVRAFTEQAVARITAWTDVSWAREESRVWRARGTEGGIWYIEIHQNQRFHQREVGALRGWVPSPGAAARPTCFSWKSLAPATPPCLKPLPTFLPS
jgi:hypothetical protein